MPQKKDASHRSGVQLGETVVRGMVMQAAARLFAQHGYRTVSVEDLLAAANVSRRTFYKTFDGKEAVAVALYKFGTDNLIENCRRALGDEGDLLTRVLRCVDLHLANAARMGRLVYVLGGEASSQESPLYEMRMGVHDRLVEMLVAARGEARVDPLLVRTQILSIEACVRLVLREGDEGRKVSEESIARARRVLQRIISGAIAGEGDRVTAMPTITAA